MATWFATGTATDLEEGPPMSEPPPTTALAITTEGLDSLRSYGNYLMTLAKALHTTDMVPARIRGHVDQVFATMAYGSELGLSPVASLQSVYLIDGTPSLSASFVRARILAAGHELQWRELTPERVALFGRRRGDANGLVVAWTIQMAREAGLAEKSVWRKYPRAMLAARATTELGRYLFADLLHGWSYTPEELGAEGPLAELDATYASAEVDAPDDADDWENVDERPAHVVAAEMLDAEDALDAEWLAEARGENGPVVLEEDQDDTEEDE